LEFALLFVDYPKMEKNLVLLVKLKGTSTAVLEVEGERNILLHMQRTETNAWSREPYQS